MQFAKVFEIDGNQVLCLLQPREEDGLPEVKMVTYVGNACVVLGNRIVPAGEPVTDPAAVLARTRELFDRFGQSEAEQAYRAAQDIIARTIREQLEATGAGDESLEAALAEATAGVTDADFGVPVVSTRLH